MIQRDSKPLNPGTEFTEEEIFRALRWGQDEESAHSGARVLSGSLDSEIVEQDGASVGFSNFSGDFLAVLSLVSEECRRKAEQRVVDQHGGRLTPEEHAAWEKRRAEIREGLVRDGKLSEMKKTRLILNCSTARSSQLRNPRVRRSVCLTHAEADKRSNEARFARILYSSLAA